MTNISQTLQALEPHPLDYVEVAVLERAGLVESRHRGLAALVGPDGETSFTGIWPGRVATEEHGEHGFGYDPVFIPEGFEVTAAELEPEVKNSMSHRALALEQLASYLNAIAD